MRLTIDAVLTNEMKHNLTPLLDALIAQDFAEVCCVGYADGEAYFRCPDTEHGLLVPVANEISADDVNSAIREL